MSTASRVPETFELTGDDAYATLKRARVRSLLTDSFERLRFADGFSHSRALAFQVLLALFPGAIVLIALALTIDSSTMASAIQQSADSFAPGPTADLFKEALAQGAQNRSGATSALIFGSLAMLSAGASAMGQIERAANRIYGVESDRPWLEKYRMAMTLALTAGTLSVIYFVMFTAGSGWARQLSSSTWGDLWSVLRWPVSVAFLTLSISLIFKASPRRRQPAFSWLAVGAVIAVASALLISMLLRLYVDASKSFGETYGPLAGFIGVALWAYLSSIALFYGLAFAAQLEAVRAGVHDPRSQRKVTETEPESLAPRTPTGMF